MSQEPGGIYPHLLNYGSKSNVIPTKLYNRTLVSDLMPHKLNEGHYFTKFHERRQNIWKIHVL